MHSCGVSTPTGVKTYNSCRRGVALCSCPCKTAAPASLTRLHPHHPQRAPSLPLTTSRFALYATCITLNVITCSLIAACLIATAFIIYNNIYLYIYFYIIVFVFNTTCLHPLLPMGPHSPFRVQCLSSIQLHPLLPMGPHSPF